MTREEVSKILGVISATYPQFNPPDKTSVIIAWELFLSDYSYNEIALALKTYVKTSGSAFPPSASQLISMLNKPKEIMSLTESEAWDLVSKAIRKSLYYSEEEFEKLPADVQRAVGSASQLRNWAETDLKTIETVIASNFQRNFRTIQKRDAEMNMLPVEVRMQIENASRNMLEGQ